MRLYISIFLIILSTMSASGLQAVESGIVSIESPLADVKQYELFEVVIGIRAHYDNPYDYDQIGVGLSVKTPKGNWESVRAFYSASGNIWKARYTPRQAGNYSYYVFLKKKTGAHISGMRSFKALPGSSNGFLRRSKESPFYAVFDSGKSFFGIGHNLAWVTNNNIDAFEKYFKLMQDNGCNITRIWINSPWSICIENEKACIYNPADSHKLDEILTLAKKYGIYLILVIDTYSTLMEERGFWNEQSWKTNIYNKLNGGPCQQPWDFFSNVEAGRMYKNRLNYIIARWSYSPNILAFQLWNETDAPADWTKEMISYIRSINPHGQLITTSLGYPWDNNFDESSIWSLDGIDIIDRHVYGNLVKDPISNIASVNVQLEQKYGKPVMTGEFGMDAGRNDAALDPKGDAVDFHNSLWVSVFSRSFSTALNWWWAEYIKNKNLYPHYKALAAFMEGLRWGAGPVDIIQVSHVRTAAKSSESVSLDITVPVWDKWGDTTQREFAILSSGDVVGGMVNAYLHGESKQDMQIEPVFHVDFPKAGKFVINIDMVSGGADLAAYLDGKSVLRKELPCGPGSGPWKKSLYLKQHDIYQCLYDEKIAIDVPAGKHTIRLANYGKDWARMKSIKLINYREESFANVRLLGLKVYDTMIFWIQNKAYDRKALEDGREPPFVRQSSFVITVQPGDYNVEWWHTLALKPFLFEKISVKDGSLTVSVPDFNMDIACKVRKAR